MLLDRLHEITCVTDHVCISGGVSYEVKDDWSTALRVMATCSINVEWHFIEVSCAGNALVDDVCSAVHNSLRQSFAGELKHFSVEIEHFRDIIDTTFIKNLEQEVITFVLIELVDHNGCLHPVGEGCHCSSDEE